MANNRIYNGGILYHMESNTLILEKRDETGGGKAKRLLDNGLIPAVIFGRGMKSTAAAVKNSDLKKLLKTHGNRAVFNAEFAEEQNMSMMIKNIQYHPVNKEIIHINFQKVNGDERVRADIPVKITGIDGVVGGGSVAVHQLDNVTVECLPHDIPQFAQADITTLKPGQSIKAGDLKIPNGVSLITKPDKVVLTLNGYSKTKETDA